MHAVVKIVAGLMVASLALSTETLRSGDLPACAEVAKVDFANMTINVPEQGHVKLKDGKGYTKRVVIDGKDYGSDWEVTIQGDMTFSPTENVTFRLIKLEVSHLTGSGAWGYALIYACKDGRLHRVFQSIGHMNGFWVKKLGETAFTLRYGVWMKNDPMARPSQERTDTYEWDSSKRAFLRTKSVQRPYEEE